MFKVTWRGVVEHPVRFAMSVVAVVLGIAFVTGTFALRGVLGDTFHDIVDSSMQADVYVRGHELGGDAGSSQAVPGAEARSRVPVALADTVAAVPGVSVALPDFQGPVVLVGADGTAVGTSGPPSFGMSADPRDPLVDLSAGRLPTAPDEVIVETSSLTRGGLAVGDRTRVIVAGEARDVTVVGELHFGAPVSGAVIVGFDPATAEAAFAPDGTVSDIVVYGSGTSEEALAAAVRAQVADSGAEAATGAEMRAEATKGVDEQIGFIGAFLLVFAVVALVVGGFLITNTFTMSVRQRLREIAVLRAVGASPAQVFASVVGQAAIVGVIGAGLGVLAGAGLVSLLRQVFAGMGMDLAESIPITGSTVTLGLVTGVVVAMAAAALPAWRASRVPPVEALTDGSGGRTERPLRVRASVGGGLVVLGVAGLVVATVTSDDAATAALSVGAGALLLGMLVVAPALVGVVARALTWPLSRVGRPLVALARGNVVRAPRRTAITAAALVVGMALVGAASTLAASAETSVAGIVDDSVHSDLILRGATGTVPVGAVADAAAVDGVAQADAFPYGPAVVTVAGSAAEYLPVGAADGLFGRLLSAETIAGDLDATSSGSALVSSAAATDHDWQVGDSLTVTAAAPSADGTTAERTLTIGGIYKTPAVGLSVIVPQTVLDAVVDPSAQTIDTVFVTLDPSASVSSVRAGIVDAVRPYVVVSVLDKDEFSAAMTSQVKTVLNVLYGLLALSVVIAVLGIVNTLALSIMERTREIGLQRAVGLSRLQLSGVTVVESVLTTLFGTVAGLVVGVGAAVAMRSVFEDQGLTSLTVPVGQLGAMLVVAVVVGVLAALWPAARAARLPVLLAVRVD